MKLTTLVHKKAISASLDVTTRNDAIKAMMQLLVDAGEVKPDRVDEYVKAVIKRENRGSTGFGNGVAVPHLKKATVRQGRGGHRKCRRRRRLQRP